LCTFIKCDSLQIHNTTEGEFSQSKGVTGIDGYAINWIISYLSQQPLNVYAVKTTYPVSDLPLSLLGPRRIPAIIVPIDYSLKERRMNQLLLVGVFIILLQTSSAQNKFYSIEGGLSKEITFYCSTRYPAIWTYTNDQAMTYPLSYLNGVHNNSDVLRIFGITSQHEGVYRCYDNQNNIDFLNLTVLAVPKFIGCSAAQSCNLGQTLEIAEGQTLSINLTMEFVNGGNRGVRQRIQFLRFINSSTNIISCGNTCTNFTTRVIPYRDPSDLWILYANITDTQVSDSNVYYVEAALEDGINSNSISVITSTLTIQVTSTTG
jgi:hypothetical protein